VPTAAAPVDGPAPTLLACGRSTISSRRRWPETGSTCARLRAEPTLLEDRNIFGAGVAHAARYGGHLELFDLPELAGHRAC
jgi:hypothetical protein